MADVFGVHKCSEAFSRTSAGQTFQTLLTNCTRMLTLMSSCLIRWNTFNG